MNKNNNDFIQFFRSHHPPNNVRITVDFLYQQWKDQLNELEKLYENRKSTAAFEPMCKGIISFLYSLFITNDRSIEEIDILHWKELIKDFNISPINVADRLDFIINRPTQYHSFIQLKLLYNELIKKYALKKSINGE